MTRLQRPLARRQHATGHLCSFSPASFTSTRSGEQWAQDTSASARHRHAVDRGEIVDGERVRQLEESYAVAILGHVAASHGQQRPSRLGGGGDESPAQAVVRGGGHEPARSADKSRPAVTRRHAEPCAVRRAGRVECAVGDQGAEEPAMAVRKPPVGLASGAPALSVLSPRAGTERANGLAAAGRRPGR